MPRWSAGRFQWRIVADVRPAHVQRLVAAVERDFFVDADMIRGALAEHSSFNLLDQTTMMKVDVFVPEADEWIAEELARARAETFDIAGRATVIRFASAEDESVQTPGAHCPDELWVDVHNIEALRTMEAMPSLELSAFALSDIGILCPLSTASFTQRNQRTDASGTFTQSATRHAVGEICQTYQGAPCQDLCLYRFFPFQAITHEEIESTGLTTLRIRFDEIQVTGLTRFDVSIVAPDLCAGVE